MTGSFTDEDVGRAFKVGEADLFFCAAVMDGRCSVVWWWSKFYVKFFERFVVKGVCFFLLMICLIAFKNETKRNPNYGKMNGLDPEMWWSRVSFSW